MENSIGKEILKFWKILEPKTSKFCIHYVHRAPRALFPRRVQTHDTPTPTCPHQPHPTHHSRIPVRIVSCPSVRQNREILDHHRAVKKELSLPDFVIAHGVVPRPIWECTTAELRVPVEHVDRWWSWIVSAGRFCLMSRCGGFWRSASIWLFCTVLNDCWYSLTTFGNVCRGSGHASIFSVLYILEKYEIRVQKK